MTRVERPKLPLWIMGLSRLALLVIVGLSCTGCLLTGKGAARATTPDQTPSPVRGAITDVSTRAGAIGGYRVSRGCQDPACIGLETLHGTKQFVSHAGQQFEPFRRAIHQSCRTVTSLFSSATAGGCVGGVPALVLWIYDWREMDAAIACAGDQIVRADSRDPVAICVIPRWFAVDD